MNSTELKKLLSLSKREKIKIVQTLWDDIAKESQDSIVPKEHIELLEKRLQRIKRGNTTFKDWDDVKKKYFE